MTVHATSWAGVLSLFLLLGADVSAQQADAWRIIGKNRTGYHVATDSSVAYSGQSSHRLSAHQQVPDTDWGASEAVIDLSGLEGDFVVIRGMLKTEEAGRAALWARVNGQIEGKAAVWSIAGEHTVLEGTQPWTPIELTLPFPAQQSFLAIGLVLYGTGTVWMDELSLSLESGGLAPESYRLRRFDMPAGRPQRLLEYRPVFGFEVEQDEK